MVGDPVPETVVGCPVGAVCSPGSIEEQVGRLEKVPLLGQARWLDYLILSGHEYHDDDVP
jgi:hypothetical protein